MDIEAAAKAMFDAFHTRFGRARDWRRHLDGDGVDLGRDTFRAMARAADAVPEPVVEAEPVAEAPAPDPA